MWSPSEATMVGTRLAELLVLPIALLFDNTLVTMLLTLSVMVFSTEVLPTVPVVVGPAITDIVESKLLDTAVVLEADTTIDDDAIMDDVITGINTEEFTDELALSTGTLDEVIK